MSDQREEQEMEAEALHAIFDASFEFIRKEQPFQWKVKLVPVDCGGDEGLEEDENHVGIRLVVSLPLEYPEVLPDLDIEIIKGLSEEHRSKLLEMARNEAASNEGMPAIFAICEGLREWLADNNVKGLDDASMHAQMIRRAREEEQEKKLRDRTFEAQKQEESITQAEAEEQAVHKRRQEGMPCTWENFMKWKEAFDREQNEKKEEASSGDPGRKTKEKKVDKSNRISGFLQFTGKGGSFDLEAMERAAEGVSEEPNTDEKLDVDENLFDLDEDGDLDDLDFDDDDEEPIL